MIILDTNIISELISQAPDNIIISWLNKIEPEMVRLTTITLLEIQYGIELLANGKKKHFLNEAFQRMLQEKFQNKILGFDVESSFAAARIAALHKKNGSNIDIRDSQIAGIAISKKAILATRNAKDFQIAELKLINPWKLNV